MAQTKTFLKFLHYWLPPLIVMGIIFYLSGRPRTSLTEVFLIDFLIFKTAHMIEYGLLFFLLFRAFYGYQKYGAQQAFMFSFAIALLYAASDEMHQTFVPNREGTPRDVFIDFLGMAIMYIYIKSNYQQIKKYFA